MSDDLIADDSEWHNLEVARRSLAASDRAAAIGVLTATLNAGLAKDEAAAATAGKKRRAPWRVIGTSRVASASPNPDIVVADTDGLKGELAAHIARHDPARVLRDVKAGRDLLAAILAERHDWNPSDEYYSCSQAVGDDPDPNVSLARGSGCSDPDRAGQPCDCGRDARVERLLRILAAVYAKGEGA